MFWFNKLKYILVLNSGKKQPPTNSNRYSFASILLLSKNTHIKFFYSSSNWSVHRRKLVYWSETKRLNEKGDQIILAIKKMISPREQRDSQGTTYAGDFNFHWGPDSNLYKHLN